MLKELTDDNFQQEVMDNKGVVLVDFYAEWCGPCKILASTVEELSDESVSEILTNIRWEKTKKYWKASNKNVVENEM